MGKGERGPQRERTQNLVNPQYFKSSDLSNVATDLYYGSNSPIGRTQGGTNIPSGGSVSPTRGYAQPSSGQATPSQGQDYQGIVQGLLGDRPLTPETMREIEPQLSQYGMQFWWNADGTRPDIVLPDGTVIDFVAGMGGANPSFAWQQKGYRTPEGQFVEGGSAPGGGGGYQGPSTGTFAESGVGGIPGMTLSDYSNIMGRFGEFADTGGFSREDLDAIRARAVSPIRSMYSSARREAQRGKALQGGYSPNLGAVEAKLAREGGQAASDAALNAEAAIARLVQQGRLAGLGGMSGIYGTTPGLANLFGSQALQAQNLSNQMALGATGAYQNAAQLPGAWDTTVGRIGQIGGAAAPWL